MQSYRNPRLSGAGRSWLQRAMIAIAAISLAIVGALFLTVALIAGAFIALVVGARWWWTLRKLRHEARAYAPLEGEYTVVERADASARIEGKSRTH
jgi:Flp pilus assembly protein TadB